MKLLSFLFVISIAISCTPKPTETKKEINPAAAGFNAAESDQAAIDIADEVMESMGGRVVYDNTPVIKWTFFGRRTLTWDKANDRCLIDIPGDNTKIMVDMKNDDGWAQKDGELVSHPDSLAPLLKQGKGMWINDSYWLVMPFKLKDSGVTLTYEGKDKTADQRSADKLALTFKDVGNTPDNKYLVYVDDSSRLVTQWDFYTSAQDTAARFTTPWANYTHFGDLLLSSDRGRPAITDIEVPASVDQSIFTEPAQ